VDAIGKENAMRVAVAAGNWFRERIGILQKKSLDNKRRVFVAFELVLMPLSLVTVAVLIAVSTLLLVGVEMPSFMSMGVLMIFAVGAVGYLTNFVAVTMLFKPYTGDEQHWVRNITLRAL